MLRTIYGDDERYQETYWSKFPGRYFAGDGAKVDEDGYWWILGRVDDVLNVAGHRIGTMEVESALVDHPAVAEAAVVGKAHELKGQALAAFVTLKEGHKATSELKDDLKEHVVEEDRRHRATGRRPLLGRPAQDPQRKDHAPAAQGHRGRTGAGRYDDPGRSGGGEPAQGSVRGGRVVGRNGGMLPERKERNGGMAEWRNGGMAEWRNANDRIQTCYSQGASVRAIHSSSNSPGGLGHHRFRSPFPPLPPYPK